MSQTTQQQAEELLKDPEILNRELEVDGQKCPMLNFLYTNFCEPGVDHLPFNNLKDVVNMNIGESLYIGLSTITRVK